MTDLDLRDKPGGIGLGPDGFSLGAVPVYDERNQRYEMPDALPAGAAKRPKSKFWDIGKVRNQRDVPKCVGMANRALLDAEPVRNRPDGKYTGKWIWKESQKVDEFPGESNSQGTSQNAACKVLEREGFYEGYAWARRDGNGLEDIYNWLAFKGPVSLCLPWYSRMNTPERGFLKVGGSLVGSHQQLVFGYSEWGTLYVQGSWGMGWGVEGIVYIAPPDFRQQFAHPWSSACAPTEVRKR